MREKFIFFFAIEALFHQDAKRVIKLYAIELSELFFLRLRKVCVKGKSYFLWTDIGCVRMYLARHFLYRGAGKVYRNFRRNERFIVVSLSLSFRQDLWPMWNFCSFILFGLKEFPPLFSSTNNHERSLVDRERSATNHVRSWIGI